MTVTFGSKSETLEALQHRLKSATILPQIRLRVQDWDLGLVYEAIEQKRWQHIPLIVRSSARTEDMSTGTQAGCFITVANVLTEEGLRAAVERVISSYSDPSLEDQVFIQPMLQAVQMSGVAFSCDPRTGAPYRVINYDMVSGATDSVTSGFTNALNIYYAYRYSQISHPEHLGRVISLLEELEALFGNTELDVEFAHTSSGELFLLQVRPMRLTGLDLAQSPSALETTLKGIVEKIDVLSQPHPDLIGAKSLFGVMPDWNPAEIIGIRPRPLALSLYQELVTDQVWATQRENYGYRSVQGIPLLVEFHGLPYIDVRASFNSFIPRNLDEDIARKLVDYYLIKLERDPSLQDKVEFDIVYSCYTLDFPMRLTPLREAGFSRGEIEHLSDCLRLQTNLIMDPDKGRFWQDIRNSQVLGMRLQTITESTLETSSKLYWLIEDCKQYGTLPFAGAARAAFIATQMLASIVEIGIFNPTEKEAFIASLGTICTEMQTDYAKLDKVMFLEKYGHLRAGTYDILSPRYDEAPEFYFDWSRDVRPIRQPAPFLLKDNHRKKLEEALAHHGLHCSVDGLLSFIQTAIQERENLKFYFTRHLSEILTTLKVLGNEHGLSVDACSYLDIKDVKKLYASSASVRSVLEESVQRGRELYKGSERVILPPLIKCSSDVWAFDMEQMQPNYVTLKKVTGLVSHVTSSTADLNGKIVMIPSADPGYDWIFLRPIAGLITMYGGVNSHMAIRTAELGLPSVIGAGELLYTRWSCAKKLEIDCACKTVRIITS